MRLILSYVLWAFFFFFEELNIQAETVRDVFISVPANGLVVVSHFRFARTRNYINKHSRLSRVLNISALISKNDHRSDFAKSNCTTNTTTQLYNKIFFITSEETFIKLFASYIKFNTAPPTSITLEFACQKLSALNVYWQYEN